MYKEDLALNNLQWLICHETQSNHPNYFSWANWHQIMCKTVLTSTKTYHDFYNFTKTLTETNQSIFVYYVIYFFLLKII